ncbi:unnamed protein product [Allacma fusca]|uniref:Uncharacterized protein n=1 Tax=Allacma fusca TaxID=39272 RepID=A0A8J2PLD3_9HEXA|nr:unnamed protein product [Allacma fusca]
MAKVANKYSYPLANRIQERITNAAVLSPSTKSRLSRSFEVAAGLGRSEGCVKFICEPWRSISSSNPLGFSDSFRLGKYLDSYLNSSDSILANLLSSWKNRLVFRKKSRPNARTQTVRVKKQRFF